MLNGRSVSESESEKNEPMGSSNAPTMLQRYPLRAKLMEQGGDGWQKGDRDNITIWGDLLLLQPPSANSAGQGRLDDAQPFCQALD